MGINKDFLSFLDLCTKKDKNAWDNFVNKYSKLIHNYIIKTLQRYNYFFQEDALEDIFSRVFLAFLDNDCRRLKNFRGQDERSFMAYLREIVFNLTVDFLREQKRFIALEYIEHIDLDKEMYKDQDKELDDLDLLKTIMTLKDELSDRNKYLFKLIYEENLGMSEIAKIMNLKLNAVHQMKFRMINSIIDMAKKKNLYYALEKSSLPNYA
jgi:RNA polymerase sigma factor (sigma-70 family)